jgi:hypothetical protein
MHGLELEGIRILAREWASPCLWLYQADPQIASGFEEDAVAIPQSNECKMAVGKGHGVRNGTRLIQHDVMEWRALPKWTILIRVNARKVNDSSFCSGIVSAVTAPDFRFNLYRKRLFEPWL